MTFKKETCKYCEYSPEEIKPFCPKCNGWGFINVAERPAPNKLINQKPSGTSANDRKF